MLSNKKKILNIGLLLTALTGAFSLNAKTLEYPTKKSSISKHRANFNRLHWDQSKFTSPEFHADNNFKYIVNVIDGSLGSLGRNSSLHYYGKLQTNYPVKISVIHKFAQVQLAKITENFLKVRLRSS